MSDNGLEAQQIRKKTLACNRKRKQRLTVSAQERLTELSQQRKCMRLLRDRETPARQSARLDAMHQCSYIAADTYISICMYYCARRSAQCIPSNRVSWYWHCSSINPGGANLLKRKYFYVKN